ncbi:MAG: hypothetical protein ACOC10_05630 [Bacteroidota bacterium]
MTFLGVLFTIFIAFLVGAMFYYIFKTTGPWGTFWSFLLILILAGLAGSFWVTPVGPVFWNVAWIPVFFIIIIFALLMAAATPPRRREARDYSSSEPSEDEAGALAIGSFFWILMSILLIIALWGALV